MKRPALSKIAASMEASMPESSEVKVPKRVRSVIDATRNGQTVVKTYRLKESGDHEVFYTFIPSGKNAPPKSCQEAIEGGYLAPVGDGLFGDDTSQSWVFGRGYEQ